MCRETRNCGNQSPGIWFQYHRVRPGPQSSKSPTKDRKIEGVVQIVIGVEKGVNLPRWYNTCQSTPMFNFEPCLLNLRVPSLNIRKVQRKPKAMASNTPSSNLRRTSHYEVLFIVQDKAESFRSPIGIIYPSLANRRIQGAELHTTDDTTSKLRPSTRCSKVVKNAALFSLLNL